ncbi:MAG TPA: hypothetical protein VF451_07970 [Acidobacteriota bacterium]
MKPVKLSSNDGMMFLVVMIWAVNLSLVKIALAEIPPLPYNCIRLLLGEKASFSLLLGAAVIFIGIYFTRRGREIVAEPAGAGARE